MWPTINIPTSIYLIATSLNAQIVHDSLTHVRAAHELPSSINVQEAGELASYVAHVIGDNWSCGVHVMDDGDERPAR
jgi:hypothetical protein